jgi:hypothetical protein
MTYEKRQKAFEKWGEKAEQKWGYVNSHPDELREAFNAGWAARKLAEYKALGRIDFSYGAPE